MAEIAITGPHHRAIGMKDRISRLEGKGKMNISQSKHIDGT
jgi:hypothetical protein